MTIVKGHTFSDGDTLTATKLNNLVDNAGDGAATFNDTGNAVDFRIEGNTDTHLFFLNGTTERISIGVSVDAPAAILEVTGDASSAAPVLQVNNLEDTINGVEIVSDSLTSGSALSVKSDSSSTTARAIAHIHQDHASASAASALKITQDNAAAASIDLTPQNSIIQLKDDSASALSFDSTGATGILKIVTTDGAEKVILSGVPNIYSTGWTNTSVTNGATLTITHNLSTQDVIVQVYVAEDGSGTNSHRVTPAIYTGGIDGGGATSEAEGWDITALADDAFTLQLGSNGYWTTMNSSGVAETDENNSVDWSSSTYIKVVVLG